MKLFKATFDTTDSNLRVEFVESTPEHNALVGCVYPFRWEDIAFADVRAIGVEMHHGLCSIDVYRTDAIDNIYQYFNDLYWETFQLLNSTYVDSPIGTIVELSQKLESYAYNRDLIDRQSRCAFPPKD